MINLRWTRREPGFYVALAQDGKCVAVVERAPVTGRWFWTTDNACGVSIYLAGAKWSVGQALCPHHEHADVLDLFSKEPEDP